MIVWMIFGSMLLSFF